ncbi:dinuclear metal center YbgI/SA1388 family protein [Desulfobaculum xiamenense]|uniref:GTP cyclohydrolase 1 type 2 homolog n=1 Tax=Desulfobaculum xiamenense TaxID=995050 RepID=A0A846QQI1_9BACT|nr:Nif3-like dinuclear metal center hexameric protein [Desulfobaculum xiamenense]NJB66929.1 dinuclear metal center YbgI/SA1388 family protein [Desulfobaculum xiamenense]
MNVRELIACIEEMAPVSGAAPWDKSGVQIAGTIGDIERIAVTIDPSPAAMAEALEWNADFILTHHPLYMEPKPLDRPGFFLDVARQTLTRGTWLYAAHTSLDVRPEGPAGWLARELELDEPRVMEQTDPGNPMVGFGLVGRLPAPMGWDAFADRLGACVERDFWVTTGQIPERIDSVAYCTGSGGSLIPAAEASGAQVYITGDIKYHQALESNIFIIDVGHFSLEETMTRILAETLASRLSGRHDAEVRFFPGREPFALRAGR